MQNTYHTAGVMLTVKMTTANGCVEGTFEVISYQPGMDATELQGAINTALARQLELINVEIFDEVGNPFDGDHKPSAGQFCAIKR